MIEAKVRALLDRYALASNALSSEAGERLAREAGQSVEFHDFRPYQAGDELRYVDWKVYARTGRLYTRLYQAERNFSSHIVLDTSASMAMGRKASYARAVAEVLSYVAQRDSVAQVHVLGGRASAPGRGLAQIPETWKFVEAASRSEGGNSSPVEALKTFALGSQFSAGLGLVLIISDLFDEAPLKPALAAFKARGLDAGFLQVMAAEDLHPEEGQYELVDAESGARSAAGPAEVRAYHEAVQGFIARTRSAILQAGFRHVLLSVPNDADIERSAFAALITSGILVKR